MKQPYTILLVDDHALFREGLASLFNAQPDLHVAGEASNGQEAIEQAHKLRPNLVLMDISMPIVDGLAATTVIKSEIPEIKIVMLTMFADDENLFKAVKEGAEGYLLKSGTATEMLSAVRAALRGELAMAPNLAAKIVREFAREGETPMRTEEEPGLTPRELEGLAHIVKGATNDEVAQSLTVSKSTVKAHVRSILSKLNVRNRAAAAAYAKRHGLTMRSRSW
jgi:DNA-binding NarL/FixJ family response regulator